MPECRTYVPCGAELAKLAPPGVLAGGGGGGGGGGERGGSHPEANEVPCVRHVSITLTDSLNAGEKSSRGSGGSEGREDRDGGGGGGGGGGGEGYVAKVGSCTHS